MGATAGAVIEPLVVVALLAGGTIVNRARTRTFSIYPERKRDDDWDEAGHSGPPAAEDDHPFNRNERGAAAAAAAAWRTRRIGFMGWKRDVWSPDTQQFANRTLSRVLLDFPFLAEVWYWAVIYGVYQLGRAITAVRLVQGTVHTARTHALQLVHLEQHRLHMFWEPAIQQYFLRDPWLMRWIDRIYSFIHIPGTILFLIGLYYRNVTAANHTHAQHRSAAAGLLRYEARRRTMAMCNLIAFVVFTVWPCMPPRLLSDPTYHGSDAQEAQSFGFVDTVHRAGGESSVWTQNKFTNQYAAMPSLHFGYSLLIGLTVAFTPLASKEPARGTTRILNSRLRVPSVGRLMCITLGFAYPSIILTAIIATANHFILDAVAGAIVCAIAWNAERLLLNLLPLEDWFLWVVRIHRPNVVESQLISEWDEQCVLYTKADSR